MSHPRIFRLFCPECGGTVGEPRNTAEQAKHQAWGHAMVSGHGLVDVIIVVEEEEEEEED